MPLERVTRVRTSDERVLTVGKNGACFVTIHDHHNPSAHAGHTFDFAKARHLAAALTDGQSASVSTTEGAVLELRGIHLGDARAFELRSSTPQDAPLSQLAPDVRNPQAKRSRGPWSLEENQRLVLAEALTKAVGDDQPKAAEAVS